MIVDHSTVGLFAENLRSRGKQPATVESYCRDAQRFLDFLGKDGLQPAHLEPDALVSYQQHLRMDEGERDNSVRRTVIGIRQFYRFLAESHAIQATPFDAVPIPLRNEALPKGLTPADVEALEHVAGAGKPACKAARDAALVSLLAHEGLKANEIINLKWSDFISEGERGSLRIVGSRGRAVPLSERSHTLLRQYKQHYQAIRHPAIAGASEKRAFIAFKGRDAASPLPVMTRHGLKFILYELGEKTGLNRLNTEQLRHYAVSYLIGLGKSPEEIMSLLGLRRLGNIAKHMHAPRLQGATASPHRSSSVALALSEDTALPTIHAQAPGSTAGTLSD